MPAAVRLMAEAVTGGDTKALIEMMAKGQLDPNKVLPKFFEQMRGISEPMLPEYFKSSRFAQGSMNKAVEDQIQNFAKTGGDEAFTRFFRLMAEAIRGAQPLITGLAGAFNRLTIALQAPVTLFKNLNMVLAEMSNLSGISEGKIVSLAAAGALLTTKWGRVFALFSGVAMVLEDISFGLQGKNSYTKDFLDFLEGKGVVMNEFEKGLFGVSAAMLAVAAAMKAMSAATSLPGLGDMFGGGKGGGKGGWLKKLLPFIGAAGIAAGATVAGVNAYTAPSAPLDEMSKNPYSPFYRNQMNINQAGLMVRDFSSGNPYYDDPKGVEQWFKDVAKARTENYMMSNTQKYGTALPGITPMQLNVEVKADIKAQNAEEFAMQLTEKIKTTLNTEIGKALIMTPQKE